MIKEFHIEKLMYEGSAISIYETAALRFSYIFALVSSVNNYFAKRYTSILHFNF